MEIWNQTGAEIPVFEVELLLALPLLLTLQALVELPELGVNNHQLFREPIADYNH